MNKVEAIQRLKKEKNMLILAHHYQEESVKEVADVIGDSLEMARIAAESEEENLMVCGVYFMAETAKILSPQKNVFLPRKDAGCPMADMITAEKLKKVKEDYPQAKVVCYVNSPAEVKAESDICCTSSNAQKIVEQLDAEEILFVPDQNLAQYIQTQVPHKRIIPWKGFCPTHHRMKSEDVIAQLSEHPGAYFMAHPECSPEVLKHAHFIGSTSQIISACEKVSAQTLIIGTEKGVIEPIQKKNPEKNILILSDLMVCPNMKKTSLDDIYHTLLSGEGLIEVEEKVAKGARGAIEKMLEVI